MTVSAIVGFMASKIIEDFSSGFKIGFQEGREKSLMTDVGLADQRGDMEQYKSEEFRYKRKGLCGYQIKRLWPRIDEQMKAQGYVSEEMKSELRIVLDELEIIEKYNDDQKALDTIAQLRKQYDLGQSDYVYRNGQLVLNEEGGTAQSIELPLVQIEDFQSDYFAIIESLDDVLHLVNQAHQDLVRLVPADAVRADHQTEQQLDYLHEIQLDIGAIYGWRVATTEMIGMSNLSAYNRDTFDKYFRTWLGYQVAMLIQTH